jgi:hypothetical protein
MSNHISKEQHSIVGYCGGWADDLLTQGQQRELVSCRECEDAYLDDVEGIDTSAVERVGNLGEVIDRRVQVYGDPTQTFIRIAQVWSGILGHEVQPVEVPLLMAGMKMVRTQVMPDYSDNSDDIDGYMDIFRQLVGEDMIHARTVNEFIEKKWGA